MSEDKGVNVYYSEEKLKELGVVTRSKKESKALRDWGKTFAKLVSKMSRPVK